MKNGNLSRLENYWTRRVSELLQNDQGHGPRADCSQAGPASAPSQFGKPSTASLRQLSGQRKPNLSLCFVVSSGREGQKVRLIPLFRKGQVSAQAVSDAISHAAKLMECAS